MQESLHNELGQAGSKVGGGHNNDAQGSGVLSRTAKVQAKSELNFRCHIKDYYLNPGFLLSP
jgi:hypothetical protein